MAEKEFRAAQKIQAAVLFSQTLEKYSRWKFHRKRRKSTFSTCFWSVKINFRHLFYVVVFCEISFFLEIEKPKEDKKQKRKKEAQN